MGKVIKNRATVICRFQDKVLFVRKPNSKWNLPGGRIEIDEAPAQAAVRELIEETGIRVDQLAYLTHVEGSDTYHHVFQTPLPESQQPSPNNEIVDCRWFSLNELAERKVTRATRELLQHFQSLPA